ncbi:HNH endonuclease [Roseateles sp.]|uniref:HNH endonuclease n=1 Tax=Roseateles sp. TaxID=1971397 RepID=UPI0039C9A27F
MAVEHACRITHVAREEHLRASHCKPWRDSSNEQRLDGENGLLLTPSIDHLFDRGFISFSDDGQVIVSPVAHGDSLRMMGVDPEAPPSVGAFSSVQRQYLDYHRDNVLLRSSFLERL